MDKKRELIHLERFKENCTFFPEGEIDCTERPDFIIHTNEKIVGIEHTEIFQPGPPDGSSLQAQDVLAQKIVKQASDLYLQDKNKPILVQIMFRSGILLKKKRIDHLAVSIYQIIKRESLLPGQIITLHRTHVNYRYFPSEIAMIHIAAQPNGENNFWYCSSAGIIPDVDADYIQEKIDSKKQEIDFYRSRCSEIWLLIVAEYLRIPKAINISRDAVLHHYHTQFNRVFIFWFMTGEYIELQLTI